MIVGIEKAKSSISRCQCCKQIIKKDELRGIEDTIYSGIVNHRYYCMSCTLNILHSSEKLIKKLIKEIIDYVKN